MSAGLNVPVSIHNTGQEPSVHICVLDADKDQRDSYPTKTNLLVVIKSHNQSSLLAVSFMFIYKCNTDPQVSTPKQSRNLKFIPSLIHFIYCVSSGNLAQYSQPLAFGLRRFTDVEYHFCQIFVMMHQIVFVVCGNILY